MSTPAAATRPLLKLEEFLPYRLNVLAETVSQALAKLYAERYGLSIPEWRVLATLGQFHTMTAKEIGRHSRMHKTKVSRAVALLEEKGLIGRKANWEDLREAFLSLTGEGRAVYESLVPEALSFSRRLVEALDANERQLFDTALRRLMARSEELAEEMLKRREDS